MRCPGSGSAEWLLKKDAMLSGDRLNIDLSINGKNPVSLVLMPRLILLLNESQKENKKPIFLVSEVLILFCWDSALKVLDK
jgi:hypothetical protein